MLFSSRIPIPALIPWCRALKHGMDVGISPVKIFRQQARSGPVSVRPLAEVLASRLEQGATLEEAIRPFASRFPTLFVQMVAVGEQTGRLTEVFTELEHYFETVITARKEFYRALIWPAMMYVSGIAVIALMLLILGLLGGMFDPIGLGLLGVRGALIFLAAAGLFTGAVLVAFLIIRDSEAIRRPIEGMVLTVPGIGSCFRAFALHRFAMALHMTAEAGLRADKSLQFAFRSTANDRYAVHADEASRQARSGQDITSIIAERGVTLFPAEFQDAVDVGETSGQLAEVMQKQAIYYRDEAARKLKILTMLAGGAVYAMVGLMILLVIVRMVMAIAGVYNDAMKGL